VARIAGKSCSREDLENIGAIIRVLTHISCIGRTALIVHEVPIPLLGFLQYDCHFVVAYFCWFCDASNRVGLTYGSKPNCNGN